MNQTLSLLALLALPCAAPQDPEAAPEPEIAARLVAGYEALAGGEEFEVGVHLRVPSGWYVSWEHPGDRGRATRVSLEAPAGFNVRGPFYPGPQRLEEPGGVMSYVYAGETVILFAVTAPHELAGDALAFRARAEWTALEDRCVDGSTQLELALEHGAHARAAPEEDALLLERFRLRLPRPLKEVGKHSEAWRLASQDMGEGSRLSVLVRIHGADYLDFFPTRSEELYPIGYGFARDGGEGVLDLECEWVPATRQARPRLRGVLRVDRGLDTTFFAVDLAGSPSLPTR